MIDALKGHALEIDAVRKSYGAFQALKAVSLNVKQGEFLTILGASGSGKTTLLKIIAGFERPDVGSVSLQGRNITHAPAAQRNIGMVFQNYALFPHMTVVENIMFPLEMRKVPKPEARRRALEALDLVHLADLGSRFPKELSGGQQQRVALARAIVFEPRLLLLDEPFSALDRRLRESLQVEVRQLQQRLNLTTIFITHDQEEALSMSDRIAIMDRGEIKQVGSPDCIYFRPQSTLVAEFVGESNILKGSIDEDCLFRSDDGISLRLAGPARREARGEPLDILIRPESIGLEGPGFGNPELNVIGGYVESRVLLGGYVNYRIKTEKGRVLSTRSNASRRSPIFELGEEVRAIVHPDECLPIGVPESPVGTRS